MKKNNLLLILITIVLFLFAAKLSSAATITSITNGNWGDGTTWSSNPTIPQNGDDVIIADGTTVTINVATNSLASLTIGQGASGILTFDGVAARAVIVTGNITVAAGGTFITQSAGTFTNTLSIGGNLVNNGTFDMSRGGSTLLCTVTFNKAGDQTISGTTPVLTQFRGITLSKSVVANRVVASIDVTMAGSQLFLLTAGTWEQTAGTLKETSGSQTIAAAGSLIISGSGNFNMAIAGSIAVNGNLTVNTSGTFSMGSGNNSITTVGTPTLNFTAGNVNIGGRLTFTLGTTNINGAVIKIYQQVSFLGTNVLGATSNAFECSSTANLTFSSGSVTIVDPNGSGDDTRTGRDIKITSTGTVNLTGSTFYLGDGISTTPAFTGGTGFLFGNLSSPSPVMYNIVMQGGGITGRNALLKTTLTVGNILTLTSGSFNLNSQVLNLSNGATISRSGGSLSAAPTFGTTVNVNYTQNGSPITTGPELLSSSTVLNNLNINSSNGVLLNGPITVNGTVTLTNGTFTIGTNSLTLQNAIAGTPGNLSADNTSSMVIAGSGSGINIPSSVAALNNLTLNNSNGTTLQGALSVAGTLTLTSGLITTSATNLLTLGIAATVSGGSSSSFVNGPITVNLRTGTLVAPIGKGTIYRPISSTIVLSAGSANITAEQMEILPSQAISVGLNITGVSNIRYYHTALVKSLDFDAQANITLSWGSDDGVTDLPRIYVVAGDNNGTPAWTFKNNDGGTSGDGTNGTITSGSYSAGGFLNGDFILGTMSSIGNPLPVNLTSFTAASSNGTIVLSWKTAVEIKNHGFDVERSTDNSTWTKLTFIQGQGNSNTPKNYSYTDNSIGKAGKYYYRLKQIDNDGAYKYSSIIESEYIVPTVFSLSQNFPNPFNPSTMITYSLPEGSNVKLSVYNSIGETIKILENGYKDAGNYRVSFNAGEFSTGIYFYKMEAGKFSQVKKMMLVK